MKGTNLGEFEEMVLLIVLGNPEGAYSVQIAKEIETLTGRKVVHSVVHASLARLLKKGMVDSRMGEATKERGGRRKRLFVVSRAGMRSLETAKAQRDELWARIQPSEIAQAYER